MATFKGVTELPIVMSAFYAERGKVKVEMRDISLMASAKAIEMLPKTNAELNANIPKCLLLNMHRASALAVMYLDACTWHDPDVDLMVLREGIPSDSTATESAVARKQKKISTLKKLCEVCPTRLLLTELVLCHVHLRFLYH